MATWTSFYVNTADDKSVVAKIAELTNNLVISYDSYFPSDLGEYQMLSSDLPPNYISVGKTQDDWTTVVHNGSDSLEDWAIMLSNHFSCKLIVTVAQSVSSYYYFALYDKGKKIREIQYCYSDDSEEIDFGNKLAFEYDKPGKRHERDGKESFVFDFEAIEDYCDHFGLNIQTDYWAIKWTVLKAENIKNEIEEFTQMFLPKRPWWKFW
jgi:hypothetical protein